MRAQRTRAIAYVRCSLDKQAEHGITLEAQRSKLTAYAELYEIELVDVIVDAGASAKTLDRPGLKRALGLLRSGRADALLVAKLDRLTRSVRDLGELIESYFASGKFALLSVGEQIDTRSAAGRLVLNVLASVGQWERETIAERTSVAIRHKASRGEYIGGAIPFGYQLAADGVRLEELPIEQSAIRAARELRASGLTLRALAEELARRGYTTRSRKPFGPKQVARMLTERQVA